MTFSSLNDIIKSTHAIDAKGGRLPIGIPGRLQVGMHGRLRRYPQKSIEADRGAAFVLFVRRNDPGDMAAISTFAERFDLTPQETRVLQTVVEVGGVPLAADVLGISPATVRTHVTSIFDKSGVRRQADLIRLLMEMKSPFVR